MVEGLIIRHELLKIFDVRGGDGLVAALFASNLSGISAIKMVLSTVTFQKLTCLGDTQSLGNGFMGLEFHK